MDSDEIDLVGAHYCYGGPRQRALVPVGARAAPGPDEAAMIRRAKKVSARIHQGDGSAESAQNVEWLQRMRSETNADIAFMVKLINNQSM